MFISRAEQNLWIVVWHATMSLVVVPEMLTTRIVSGFRGRFSSLVAADSSPSPGKPIELIKDLSLLIRSSLGEGLPGLGSFVIVPPVTYPKPRCSMDGRNFIFLSKPAASPIGFFNFRPARFVCRISSSK